MSNLNLRTKAALLAFGIAVSSSNVFCSQVSTSTFASINNFLGENKKALLLSTLAGLLVAGEICLITDQRVTYNYDNWTADVKELLNAYNVFNEESRATIKRFIKKYFVGARVRLDDLTVRTKEENGSVSTIKRKKLTQKPSGLIGLLDAYVLSQMKTITEFITPAVTLYVLITDPRLAATKELKNYKKDDHAKDANASKPVTIEEVKQVLQMLHQVVPNDVKVV